MLHRRSGAIFLLVTLVVLALSVGAAFAQGNASTPVSNGGVTPYIIAGENSGGNRTCAEVGLAFFGDANYYEFSSERVNYNSGVFDQAFPGGLTVNTDGTYVSFSSTFGIGAVIVKGGNDANVYVYEPQRTSDSGLAAPPNASGNPAGLSNITFCWNPEPPPPGDWCSPGFWRQLPPHNAPAKANHSAAWALTGVDPLQDAGAFGAPNYSLIFVLNNPQIFGGTVTNAIADYLSAAAGLTGTQANNSGVCPL